MDGADDRGVVDASGWTEIVTRVRRVVDVATDRTHPASLPPGDYEFWYRNDGADLYAVAGGARVLRVRGVEVRRWRSEVEYARDCLRALVAQEARR